MAYSVRMVNWPHHEMGLWLLPHPSRGWLLRILRPIALNYSLSLAWRLETPSVNFQSKILRLLYRSRPKRINKVPNLIRKMMTKISVVLDNRNTPFYYNWYPPYTPRLSSLIRVLRKETQKSSRQWRRTVPQPASYTHNRSHQAWRRTP